MNNFTKIPLYLLFVLLLAEMLFFFLPVKFTNAYQFEGNKMPGRLPDREYEINKTRKEYDALSYTKMFISKKAVPIITEITIPEIPEPEIIPAPDILEPAPEPLPEPKQPEKVDWLKYSGIIKEKDGRQIFFFKNLRNNKLLMLLENVEDSDFILDKVLENGFIIKYEDKELFINNK